MQIDPNELLKIAKLAKLKLTEDELPALTERLSAILTLVDTLQTVDTQHVAPMAHPLDLNQRLRPDVITETDQRDAFQAIAPATKDGLYLVPAVLEEEK